MFFTARDGLFNARKRFYKNEFCSGYEVLYVV